MVIYWGGGELLTAGAKLAHSVLTPDNFDCLVSVCSGVVPAMKCVCICAYPPRGASSSGASYYGLGKAALGHYRRTVIGLRT